MPFGGPIHQRYHLINPATTWRVEGRRLDVLIWRAGHLRMMVPSLTIDSLGDSCGGLNQRHDGHFADARRLMGGSAKYPSTAACDSMPRVWHQDGVDSGTASMAGRR